MLFVVIQLCTLLTEFLWKRNWKLSTSDQWPWLCLVNNVARGCVSQKRRCLHHDAILYLVYFQVISLCWSYAFGPETCHRECMHSFKIELNMQISFLLWPCFMTQTATLWWNTCALLLFIYDLYCHMVMLTCMPILLTHFRIVMPAIIFFLFIIEWNCIFIILYSLTLPVVKWPLTHAYHSCVIFL